MPNNKLEKVLFTLFDIIFWMLRFIIIPVILIPIGFILFYVPSLFLPKNPKVHDYIYGKKNRD